MSHSPLSEHEKSLLEQLEKQFKEDDPTFAKAMEEVPAAPNRSAFHIVAGVTAVVAGFLLLLLGTTLPGPAPNILVGVLGFAMMVAGAFLAVRHTSVTKNRAPAPTFQKAESAEKPKTGKDRRPFRDTFGDWALWGLFWWV